MIEYSYNEEKVVALFLANELEDSLAKKIIQKGKVINKTEAIHLSKFFWAMVNRSAEGGLELPCEGSSQYWTEKLYNSLGGYLERVTKNSGMKKSTRHKNVNPVRKSF